MVARPEAGDCNVRARMGESGRGGEREGRTEERRGDMGLRRDFSECMHEVFGVKGRELLLLLQTHKIETLNT